MLIGLGVVLMQLTISDQSPPPIRLAAAVAMKNFVKENWVCALTFIFHRFIYIYCIHKIALRFISLIMYVACALFSEHKRGAFIKDFQLEFFSREADGFSPIKGHSVMKSIRWKDCSLRKFYLKRRSILSESRK